MDALRSIIIDDEPLARKGLKEYISDVDFLILSAEFDQALKAAEMISKGEVQLIFLDIQMPKMTGLEFLKSVQHAPPVIFTTAYPQYALDGFELNALDYLVKPISFERFFKAALKAKEYYEVRIKNKDNNSVRSDYFFIKYDGKLVKISYENILYVEALQNYVCVCTKNKKYITYLTFKSIQDYLPESSFIRTHKSYIVAADKIDSIEANEILIGQYRIPISRAMKDEVLDKLTKGKFLKR